MSSKENEEHGLIRTAMLLDVIELSTNAG